MFRKRAYRLKPPRGGRAFVRGKAGGVGAVATLVMGAAGVVVGATAAFISQNAPAAYAVTTSEPHRALREGDARALVVERILSGGAPERLSPPGMTTLATGAAPKIILIFDDMGLDRAAFDRIMALPGPVTLSFLPYASGVDSMVGIAAKRGDAIMAHVPMEPEGVADPGPGVLTDDMTDAELRVALGRNLSRVPGVIGVNNHMGSLLTQDRDAMRAILAELAERDIFFLDSVTTPASAARQAADELGVRIFSRDVFLDANDGREEVMRQLRLVEEIARETGYAIAICHPRADTLAMVGPWLTSAPSRGFKLETVQSLIAPEAPPEVAQIDASPMAALRQ